MRTQHQAARRGYRPLLILIALFVPIIAGCGGSYSGGGNAPYISSLSVASGPVGTPVTITGMNFGAAQGASTLKFNGTSATPTSWSNTSIIAPVPSGATTGNVVVTVGGVPSNGMTFTVTAASAPSISMLSPTSGAIGSAVTITGTNFGASQGTSTVTFNGANAGTTTTWSNTTIVVPVPIGATNGPVIVTVGGVPSNGMTFTVTAASAPSISMLSPTSGAIGSAVTITGTNFGASQVMSTVTFNGSIAGTATSWSNTSIVAAVPSAATTGNVVVTVGGVASNGVSFTVTGSTTAKWPIKANGRYFTDSSTPPNPWLMVGDSAHHLINVLPISSWSTYLSNRQSHGFNTVNIFSCGHGNCPSTGATANGQLPFTTMITSTCNGAQRMDYDLSTPNIGTTANPGYWMQIDSFINTAATYGLVVLIDPLTTADYMNDMRASGSTKAFNFGVFLGTRYKNFPNIIWELGNDFQTWTSTAVTCPAKGSDTDNTLVQQLMAGIASADPNHIQTIQLDYYRSYSNQDAALDPYLKADGLYTLYETYDYALQAYNSTPATPVFLTEANLETGNNTHQNWPNGATAQVLRYQMWWTMTSGAAGHIWGNEHVSHFDMTSPTWQSQLDTTATTQVQYLTSLFSQFSWWNLAPEQSHKVVTSGYGTPAPNNQNLMIGTYATTTWDGSSLAITYTPIATTLTVNMANFTKTTINASWYDPTTGVSAPIGSFSNSGSQAFKTPGTAHSDGTQDWVLVLQ